MHALFKVLAFGFLLVLAAACVAPPPSPEQATAYAQIAESRATEAAAAERIAAAKATEAAAAQQITQLTTEAAASMAVTTTATVSPTILISSTIPATSTAVLSPTVQVSLTLTDLLATPIVTATVEVTATPEVSATALAGPPVTATLAVTNTATPAVSLTATATPTVTAPRAVTITATPPPTVAVDPTATSTVTPATPLPAAAGTGWVWPGLPASEPSGQVAAATPTLAPTPVSFGTAVVTSQQANVRGGPGTSFPVVATARQGTSLQVTGSNEGQSWWRVCCVNDQAGWISQTIARFQGDRETVPVAGPLMPDDLSASWELRWECHGSGCNQAECLGQSEANALRVLDDRWLEVARESSWPEECGEPEDWLTQIDRYTGKERQSSASATLFNIWEGANPGENTRTVDLLGSQLAVWCTDTRTQEVEQQDGWTVLYEGQACYDTKAGVLALMQYVKRWLFSGTVNGQTFDREYFGDYEVYQQVLTGTNAPLSDR
ncbi:MAG: SH3 domain-containing protein [Caldilineae bacterium]|nr:SH3 domain-containing protein [Caldilineae bacterium]